MIDILLSILPVALATGGLVDLFFNGSLPGQEDLRAFLKAKGERGSQEGDNSAQEQGQLRFSRVLDAIMPNWVAEAFSCPWCLSAHVSGWITICTVLPWMILSGRWWEIPLTPLVWLGAWRVSWIANGFLPERMRYTQGE